MKYLSICSGIEAASVAFGPLGWKPLAFSEIEAFPRAVLKHHYPDTPCHGDFTLLKDEPWIVDADMLCGGTPCQAFSVAGNRQSLADDRGNLTLQFVLLADAIDHLRRAAGREPAWILWENVPGVLSTSDNAFGAFLGGLCGRDEPITEPADGWTRAGVVDGPSRVAAWRVLDAQHFGLAQRRQRVFVLALGGAGRWAAADALLPLIESSRWHPAPRRGKGEGVAGGVADGAGSGSWWDGSDTAGTLTCNNAGGEQRMPDKDNFGAVLIRMREGKEGGRPLPVVAFAQNQLGELRIGEVAGTLNTNSNPSGRNTPMVFDPAQVTSVANRSNPQPGDPCHTLHRNEPPMLVRMREGKEGGGKGPLVSEDQSLTLATANDQILAFQGNASATNSMNPSEVSPTLDKSKANGLAVAYTLHGTPATQGATANDQVLAYRIHGENSTAMQGNGVARVADPAELARCLDTCGGYSANQGGNVVQQSMQVRRLTPVECERLQGFPDGYTNIPWRGKPADQCPDGPRYKALGNSWAVPCARWIGERIKAIRP